MLADTAVNLLQGLRLALLLPVKPEKFRGSLGRALLLMLAGALVVGGINYSIQQGEIYFNDFGASFLGLCVLIIVLLVAFITRSQGSLDRLPDVLTVVFSAFPWLAAGVSVLALLVNPYTGAVIHWLAALVWVVAVIARGIQLVFPLITGRALLGIAAIMAAVAVGAYYRGVAPVFFWSYDAAAYEDDDAWKIYEDFDSELVLLSQRDLLDEELRRIDVGVPDATELYFLGFAGNGDEPVFDKEVNFAATRVSDTFATTGRSLVLSTNVDSVLERPLANTHNLFATLAHYGGAMDADEDVLFLFLSSHGSKDASLQVELYPLELRQLYADDLREALDAAGIRWRVIVISACYSGSFIEALEDEHTLVMTAAAPDKTSFGCSMDRDLTYFGEAFFQDAWPSGEGMLTSFDEAKASIGDRERREGRTQSEPQIFIGDAMRAKLAEIERRSGRDDAAAVTR